MDEQYKTEAARLVTMFMSIKNSASTTGKQMGIGRFLARECAKRVCDERMHENPDKWTKVKQYLSIKQWS